MSVALNDSASALSALVPTAPIDWVTPSSAQSPAKAFERVLGAVIGVEDRPGQRPRVSRATDSASTTRSVRMWSATAHPASRREKQSITVARYRFDPSAIGR